MIDFTTNLERLHQDYRQLLATGAIRTHRPCARLLVEFYVDRFGIIRAIVDGINHDNREDISFQQFCGRAGTRDEYRQAMQELLERSEILGVSVKQYIKMVFGERFPKWDLVVTNEKIRVDENEIDWNGYGT